MEARQRDKHETINIKPRASRRAPNADIQDQRQFMMAALNVVKMKAGVASLGRLPAHGLALTLIGLGGCLHCPGHLSCQDLRAGRPNSNQSPSPGAIQGGDTRQRRETTGSE
jgi:hypothetical protein